MLSNQIIRQHYANTPTTRFIGVQMVSGFIIISEDSSFIFAPIYVRIIDPRKGTNLKYCIDSYMISGLFKPFNMSTHMMNVNN